MPVATRFDVAAFLGAAGVARRGRNVRAGERIFSQGDPADSVLYIQRGRVKLSVVSRGGKEAVVAVLGAGDFLGESALAGGPVRLGSATALESVNLVRIDTAAMARLLHEEHAMADRFIEYMVSRNMRVEADLVDQLFNSSERRLARTLLQLARYGRDEQPMRVLPKMSQEVLAGMVGTTRSRINFFLNKFRRLGFISYTSGRQAAVGIKVNPTLLSVLMRE
jgi:CRP/FNR family cyclic AMP-dependent transcriptional regulator